MFQRFDDVKRTVSSRLVLKKEVSARNNQASSPVQLETEQHVGSETVRSTSASVETATEKFVSAGNAVAQTSAQCTVKSGPSWGVGEAARLSDTVENTVKSLANIDATARPVKSEPSFGGSDIAQPASITVERK